MPNNIDKSKVDSFIPEVWADAALLSLRAQLGLANTVNRDYEDEVSTFGDKVRIPQTGSLSANDKSANSSVTKQNPADSEVTVDLNKHKEATFAVEDPARVESRPDLLQSYMEEAMIAVAEQVENDCAAQVSNFSNSVGDGSSDLSLTNIRDARKNLSDNRVPQANRYLALDPAQYNAFLGTNNIAFSDRYGNNNAIQEGQFGTLYGFNVIEWLFANTNTTPSPDELENAAYHPNAMTLVTRPLPVTNSPGVEQGRSTYQDLSVRVTRSYDKDELAYQITVDILYGVSTLRADHGVLCKSQTS